MLLVTRLKFYATFTAPSCARAFVGHALHSWLLAHLVDTAELIVSELVTNAVKATGITEPSPTYKALSDLALIAVQVRVEGESLFIEVWDSNTDKPNARVPDDELAEFGRGIAIVDSLSRGMGCEVFPNGGGKVVWAELDAGSETTQVRQSQPDRMPRGLRRVTLAGTKQTSDPMAADLALIERAGHRPCDVRF